MKDPVKIKSQPVLTTLTFILILILFILISIIKSTLIFTEQVWDENGF